MNDTVSMKEYIDARLGDLSSTIEGTRQSMEKRLDGMNEFRDSLKDQADKFATKQQVDSLEIQVQELRVIGGGASARDAALTKYIGWVIAAVALAIAYWK